MPICITCSTPVRNLYTTYSKADDRSLGKGVRLTQCPNCKRFADKYVEHDYVVLFIDLVLIKPQVYRHLLFNRLGRTDDKLDPSILRLGILLVLFDVYITWARIEKSNDSTSVSSEFSNAPIVTQYFFFLTLNVVATLAQHITIRLLVKWIARQLSNTNNPKQGHHRSNMSGSGGSGTTMLNKEISTNQSTSQRSSPAKQHAPSHSGQSFNSVQHDDGSAPSPRTSTGVFNPTEQSSSLVHPSMRSMAMSTVGPGHALPSAISTALLVSSCTKLFPILLVIWPTSSSDTSETRTVPATTSSFAHHASNYIGWIVLLNNVEALHILLDCGYLIAGLVAIAGVVSRWLAEGFLLSLVGLMRDGGGYGDGPVSDIIRLWVWMSSKSSGN